MESGLFAELLESEQGTVSEQGRVSGRGDTGHGQLGGETLEKQVVEERVEVVVTAGGYGWDRNGGRRGEW